MGSRKRHLTKFVIIPTNIAGFFSTMSELLLDSIIFSGLMVLAKQIAYSSQLVVAGGRPHNHCWAAKIQWKTYYSWAPRSTGFLPHSKPWWSWNSFLFPPWLCWCTNGSWVWNWQSKRIHDHGKLLTLARAQLTEITSGRRICRYVRK